MHGSLLTEEALREVAKVDPYKNCRDFFESRPRRNRLERLLYTDQKSYLLELLMKQDKMSMAASIESRVPFLDHELVEFAAGVPAK